MTTLSPPIHNRLGSPPPAGSGGPADNYLNHKRGLLSWLVTLDHKRIAVLYLYGVAFSLFLGGLFALLIRIELVRPGPTLLRDANKAWDLYNHVFTLHGAVMVFMFIIPAIPAVLGNFLLPMMLGAKDLAFPRLNLASFYLWVIGGLFFVYVLISGVYTALTGHVLPGGFGLDTGWTFYTPYSTSTNTSVTPAVLGAFILGFSSILTGVNFIASIHMLRPVGMTWFRMPLFLWGLYATSVIQILATPVLGITLLLLAAERLLRIGIFDPQLNGDPILFQHFFWFYSHPAVYLMILPAMACVSEIISANSRKHIFGYAFIACSSMAIALIGFLVWGHHMFVSGQSPLANMIFSFLTFLVAIPSAIKVFNWIATMYKGNIQLNTAMLYALGFIWLFTIGGLTGLFLGALATDIHLTDTYFIVAHFHFVMVGATLFAFIGGMYFWWPKMFGKMVHEKTGKWGFWLVFVGFNVTFLPLFVAGSHGMPRRYADYLPQFTRYHEVATLGAFILAIGLFLVLYNWIASFWNKTQAPNNPWGSNSLEWRTPSPPPWDNFPQTPVAGDPYDVTRWKWDETIGGYVEAQ